MYISSLIEVPSLDVDLSAIMAHKATAVDGLTRGIEGLFKKNKVKYEVGFGAVVASLAPDIKDKNTVEVTAADGSKKQIKTKNIVIATGSDVSSIPALPIDEKQIVSSTGALSLSAIPKRLIVVGGGVIGLELGSVWQRLGAEVLVR
jgi:dihydrolipoamide dehydrogenase